MIFAKVSVLVPTRGRVNRLRTLLASYEQTTCGATDSELIFRVDDDDHDTQDFLLDQGGHFVIIGSRLSGYRSLPTFFNEMFRHARGDVLMCGNDDMVFKTMHWPFVILEAANRYPDGLFDLGVSTHNETHYPFSTISRRAAEVLGFVWDPRIFWGDMFLRDVMAAFGRCVMLPSVQIDHDWVGHQPDYVFEEGNPQRFLPRGSEYWVDIHQQAVNDAVSKLRVLA